MTNSHRRLLAGVSGAVCTALFFLLFFIGSSGGSEEPPTTQPPAPPAGECAKDVHYFRHDLAENDNRFGEGFDWPTWQKDPKNDLNKDGVVNEKDVQIDLRNHRCVDPALVTGHVEYAARSYSTPEERTAKTEALVADRTQWAWSVVGLSAREQEAVSVEVVEMSDPYKTLYMIDTPVPGIYQDALDRPTYWVLRFTYADGTQDNFKLDCGYQPVEPEFPGVPGPPGSPPPTQPPVTGPPSSQPPTTGPPTTAPPTTCPPTVCKGPAPSGPPPCVDMYGNVCTQQPGAGGNPGNGGAVDHGDDGYSPEDPPPTTIVPPAPPPSSIVTIPPTTAPPPPTTLVIPG